MRPLVRTAAAALFALALVSCGEEVPTERFQLSGVVRDGLSGRTISGALVEFSSDTLYRASTRSGGNGVYEMIVETDTPFGQVRASRDGFRAAEETVFFDTRERRVDIELQPE